MPRENTGANGRLPTVVSTLVDNIHKDSPSRAFGLILWAELAKIPESRLDDYRSRVKLPLHVDRRELMF